MDQSFLDLSTDYKLIVLKEIYYLTKHLNMSYADVMAMPVFERKFFLQELTEDFRKQNEQLEKSKNRSNI